jgi:hypothetical protein
MPEHASNATDAEANVVRRWGGRVPIVIGAIGHRDIRPADGKLAAAVRNECRKLKKQFSSSPFAVLSALAEGADRLIARTAMEELQADLIAVLPMPAEDYECDFETEDSRTEFRAFLDRAACTRAVPLPEGDAWKVKGEPRNEQYARAGSIIVDHAHVLFSIWDGEPIRGTGGTADQVSWFQRGYSPAVYSLPHEVRPRLDPAEPGRSINIDPFSAKVTIVEGPEAHGGAKSKIKTILKKTNRYNAEILSHRITASTQLVNEPALNLNALANSHAVYSNADSYSTQIAKTVRRCDSAVYLLAIVAVIIFSFINNKFYAPRLYLATTLVMLAIAGAVWLWSLENRFLEYRGLAEGMRVLYFWRSSGVKASVWTAFLSGQAGVVHWIRQAVRSIEFCQDSCLEQVKYEPGPDGVAIAKRWWVEDQRAWFASRGRYHFSWFNFWKWVARVAIIASFATAIALAAFTFIQHESGKTLWDSWVAPAAYGDFWQVLLGFFAGGGITVRGFASRRAHLELAKAYASQRQVFETASLMLEEGAMEDVYILEQLGEAALLEHAEWVWLRHSRPFEMPA